MCHLAAVEEQKRHMFHCTAENRSKANMGRVGGRHVTPAAAQQDDDDEHQSTYLKYEAKQ